MDLNDPRWGELKGGYRIPYDPRPALRALESASDTKEAWAELWNELHHQGDVDLASYAAVPHLVRICSEKAPDNWNYYAIASLIEQCRAEPDNPAMPAWLQHDYDTAWEELYRLSLDKLTAAKDDDLVHSLFAVLAHKKGLPLLARIAVLTEAERKEMLEEAGWG